MTRSPHISEDRIRERAYRLWIEEGQPQGKDAEHWQKARELLALEADPKEGKEGIAEGANNTGPWDEPVEEAATLENQGEVPTLTDQGEQQIPKKRRPAVARRKTAAPKPKKKRPM
ncbi:DUF2934 domain-containing protein [Taklimakanibacter lacteus]|uniref:DUF2934 domain-containing protein n=1 Tax=Taklimakanibacter lacteus TaxID=2268456 RepID=UPI0034D55EDD